jgi:DNA-binding winged helix-turn-helix (wHTH) protein/TolB-like protein
MIRGELPNVSVSEANVAHDAVLRFEDFSLDHGNGLSRLNAIGQWAPVVVGSRALDVLAALVGQPGELVTRQTLMDATWPGTVVEDANLTVQISALRQILDEGRADGSCIQTIIGRGYRFVAPVTRLTTAPCEPTAIVADAMAPGTTTSAVTRNRRGLTAATAAAIVAVSVAAGGWWLLRDSAAPPVIATVASSAPRPAAYSPKDRRQSLIVLTFESTSGDPAQDGLAGGITRDVTDLIAEDATVPLVPPATAAAYSGKTLDLRKIASEHDVHFVLTGSAGRQDGRLLVAATLYQTYDERPVWSRKYDRSDSPGASKTIVHDIRAGFNQATMDAEIARAMSEHPGSLDKRDLMFAASATSPPTSSNLLVSSKGIAMTRIALIDVSLVLDPK